MMTIATLATLAALAVPQTDTAFAVYAGARLDLENFAGEVQIRAWNRNEVRIQAEHGSRDRVEVSTTPSVVRVRARSQMGPPPAVTFRLSVPAKMAVDVSGPFTGVSIEGSDGDVSVQTVQGSIAVRGGRGVLRLRTVEGKVDVEGARGRLRVSSVDEDVRIARTSGEVIVETVDGDIVLEEIDSEHVEASTVDGDIRYRGTIRDNGRYRFAAHDGDIVLVVPARVNATVSVATFAGEFSSDFPVTLQETRRGQRFTFVLGTGSAKVELNAFDGTIELRRAP